MKAMELLSLLRERDIQLWVEEGKLRFNAPKGALTDELRSMIVASKEDLISFLQTAQSRKINEVPPIEIVSREKRLPLSFAQQRLWFMDQLEEDNPFYNVSGALRFSGKLNINILQKTIDEIVQRHEVLRTSFVEINGQPSQEIISSVTCDMLIENLSVDSKNIDEVLKEKIEAEAQQIFDLSQGPLIRTKLLKLSEQEHILLLTMHHIIFDGWSLGVLINEMMNLYQILLRGDASPLPELSIQYADYAVWQRNWLQGEILDKQLNYWKSQLDNIPVLNLPTDRSRPAVQTYDGARLYYSLSEELTVAIKKLAREQDSTLFMTLFSAYEILLAKYSQQEEFCIGIPIANRNHEEIENLIGFFVNTLALRADLSGNPTFTEILRRVRDVTLGAYAHQDLPFERLVDELEIVRDLSRNPLFQTMFVLQNAPEASFQLPDLTITGIVPETYTSKFDLSFEFTGEDPTLDIRLEYNTNLFDEETMWRFIRYYENLLKAIIENPDCKLSDLNILTNAETKQILNEYNENKIDYPDSSAIHQLFEIQTVNNPDAIALTFEGNSVTYKELNEQSNRLAHYLIKQGIKHEDLIGVCVDRSFEMIISVLAIWKAGAAYLPLDPGYPVHRLTYMLQDANITYVIINEQHAEKIKKSNAHVIDLKSNRDEISDCNIANPDRFISPEQLAYVIYTSGSTGKPKGVASIHRGVCNLQQAQRNKFNVSKEDCILQFASLSFDASVWEICMALCSGARLLLASKETLTSPEECITLLKDQSVTIATLPPSFVKALPMVILPLRVLITAGEACTTQIVQKWGLERLFVNAYGPSETTVCATWAVCDSTEEKAPSIGKPIDNAEIYVLDKYLQPVPMGVVGELYIGGAGVVRGYLNRPDLTADRFIPNPFCNSTDALGERLYRSGDLVRYHTNGQLEFIGRADFQEKIRGFRIELGEIDNVIRQHALIQESVTVVKETQDNKSLITYLVAEKEGALKTEKNIEQQSEQVSEWQMFWDDSFDTNNAQSTDYFDPEFDITNWNSTYDGKPLPVQDMREWVEQTVNRIKSLQPKRVLEIGCGSGLLLFRLAPHCESYWGSDFSARVLERVQAHVEHKQLPQVRLLHQMADDFDEVKGYRFDTLVINSVAQYFPSIDYLVEVLQGAIENIDANGKIFLGDIRNLALQEIFMSDVEYTNASKTDSIAEVNRRVTKRLANEEELVIDPIFFYQLKEKFSRISKVKILPKLDNFKNELTQFRFDVVLHIEAENELQEKEIDWINYISKDEFVSELSNHESSELLGIKAVPDTRTTRQRDLLAALDRLGSAEKVSALNLDENLTGIEINELLQLIEKNNLFLETALPNKENPTCWDLILSSNEQQTSFTLPLKTAFSWTEYANNPLNKKQEHQVVPVIRQYLQEVLPEYMLPLAFVVLPDLPLNPNGKVERSLLPEPNLSRDNLASTFVAPRNDIEEQLVSMWSEVLKIDHIGIHDNFFELGGHSLLATQIVSRIRDKFLIEFAVRDVFSYPTIEDIAVYIASVDTNQRVEIMPYVEPVPRDQFLPLSLVQQSYWFLDQLEGGESATYNMPTALSFKGHLDVAALETVLQEIITRHEVLRTRFIKHGDIPGQEIVENAKLQLNIIEISEEDKVQEYINIEAQTAFRLDQDLPIRAKLIKLPSDHYVLIVTMHHIVSDGWSLGILVNEISTLYKAYIRGEQSPLPALPVQYADYAYRQRKWLDGERFNKQVAFWKKTLENAVPLLELPTDRPRPPAQSYRGATKKFTLSSDLKENLNVLSRQHGVTLFVVLLSAFKILLSRYSNSKDLSVGTAIANRSRPELENMVGFFVNTLTLRTQIDLGWTFKELLNAVNETTLNAYANSDVPFDVVVNAVQPERSLSLPPLFQVMFRLHNTPMRELDLPGLSMEQLFADTQTAKLDLNFSFIETDSTIEGFIEYATDLFDVETIERFAHHYQILLEAIVETPDSELSRLPLISANERSHLITDCNATDMQYSRTECMHELFEVQATQSPDKLAYVCGDERLTYKMLNDRANQLAHYLQAQGVGPEVRVGLSVGRNSWMAIGMLAIFKAGGTYVPLDPNYPQDRLAHMLDDTRPLLLLTETSLLTDLPEHQADVVCLNESSTELSNYSTDNPDSLNHAEHSAYILYTSGSTGKPKGILVAHKSFRNMANAHKHMHVYDENSRVLQFASLSFSISLWGSFMGWLCGGCVYQVTDESSLPGDALLTLLQTEKINTVTWPVSLLSILPSDGLPELKTVISSAEPCNENVMERWGTGRRFMNMYGNSEVSLGSTVYDHLPEQMMSIGRPLPNTQMYILNESLEPCPIGVKGEICTAGVGLARGYINRAAATAEKFIPNPFSTEAGSRLYRTGDLGYYLADGSIVFVGREDFQVSVRGFRIELKEIEIVLREHPAVKEVAVVTKADHQGQDRLVAYVVTEKDESITYRELRHLLSDRLPSYMLPSIFVTLDGMPLTPNRKVDRLNLPEPDIEAEISREYVAPSTETEKALAGIWQAILDIDKIGVNNHFFEIGGHSLLAVQVASRIEQEFSIKLPVRSLFEYPRIAEMAIYIEDLKEITQSSLSVDMEDEDAMEIRI